MSSNKNFGIVFFIIFLALGLYPLINDGNIQVWFLIISIVFLILGFLDSKILTPFNKIWYKFGILLGKFFSPLIMLTIFFLIVTPTGIFMRLMRKDLLNLKFKNTKSYWIEKKGPKSKMKNQF